MAINSKKITFNGESATIFYEEFLHRPITAIANVLSIRGELSGALHTKATYSVEEVTDFVARRLMDVRRIPIDVARKCLARLVKRLELYVNYRRIEEFEDFKEKAIFTDLGINLYHGWKVVPEYYVSVFSTSEAELAAKGLPLLEYERNYVRNCYDERICTIYGYKALCEDLQHVENQVCVFYWNMKFYTLRKNVNGLDVLSYSGELEGIFEGENKLIYRGPSLGGRKFFLTCAGMNRTQFNYIQQDFRDHKDLLLDIDIDIDYEESLKGVVQNVLSEKYTDMILFRYHPIHNLPTGRELIKEWRESLRYFGFVGVVGALCHVPNIELEDGITGITFVDGMCTESGDLFRRDLLPLIKEAMWRKEVVFPVEFPADLQSYHFIGREIDEFFHLPAAF